MINMIMNEKVYAEQLLNDAKTELKPYFALAVLARYYYHNQGFRKKKIMQHLNLYLQSHYMLDPGQLVKWQDTIEKLTINAKKYPLHEINGIGITVKEMETIGALSGAAMKRLAFTVLCLAKLGNLRNPKNNGWVNDPDRDIFKLANISCNALERQVKIGTLYRNGLLEFTKRNDDLSIRVTYIDDTTPEVMFIEDLRNLGYQYTNQIQGGYVNCSECGRYIKKQPGRKKPYCKDCLAPASPEKKSVKCMDCGNYFWVSNHNRKSKRCPYCYKEYRRDYKKAHEAMRRAL